MKVGRKTSKKSEEAFPGIPLHCEGDKFLQEFQSKQEQTKAVDNQKESEPKEDEGGDENKDDEDKAKQRVRMRKCQSDPLPDAVEHQEKAKKSPHIVTKSGSSRHNIFNLFKSTGTENKRESGNFSDGQKNGKQEKKTLGNLPHLFSHKKKKSISNMTNNTIETPSEEKAIIPPESPPTQTCISVEEDEELYRNSPCTSMKARIESGVSSTQGKRNYMEDIAVIFDDFYPLIVEIRKETSSCETDEANELSCQDCSFFGVYDGHAGREAAEATERVLHRHIVSNSAFPSDIAKAIFQGYLEADRELYQEALKTKWKSGAVVVTVLRIGTRLFVGNAGDSEAILGRKWSNQQPGYRPVVLSYKHKPTNADEKERIESEGGFVFHGRVYGTLAISRALGDFDFKKPTAEGNFVSPEPCVKVYDLKPQDSFLVLGCDGLWDRLSYEEVTGIVCDKREQGCSASEVATSLVNAAVHRESHDNITAVVVFFNWQVC